MGTTITDLLREAHLLMAAAAPPSLFGPFQKNCSRQLGFRQIRFSETGLPALGIPLRASSARRLLNYRITLVLSFKLVGLLCLVLLSVGVVGAPLVTTGLAPPPTHHLKSSPGTLSHYSPIHRRGATSSSSLARDVVRY